jgi:hypothetical protein
MKGKMILFLGIALAYVPPSFAQTTGRYIGLGVARATYYIKGMTFDTLPYSYLFTGYPAFHGSLDNSSTTSTWSLYGGYQFTRYFGIEAFYQPIGMYTRQGSNRGLVDPSLVSRAGLGGHSPLFTISDTDTLHLRGYGIAAVASVPVADYIFIIGRAGGFYWTGTLNRATTFYEIGRAFKTINLTENEAGYSPMIGVGLRIEVKRGFSVRAEWTRIDSIGGGLSTGKSYANISTFSVQFNI